MAKPCCIQIPETIREELENKGGIKGIQRKLPSEKELTQESNTHKALADPTRLKILHMLTIQPLCVCLIKTLVDMPDSKLSYHLNILKKTGLIEGKREGNWIIYRATKKGQDVP